MQQVKDYSRYLYKHPLVRYIVVGGSTFIIDFGLLVVLHQKAGFGIALATSIAYWVAIAYNFFLNRSWTFSVAEKESLHKHLASYLILLGFNYVFTVIFVSILSRHIYFGAAKALAVIIQTTWTYKVYKDYIFVK
ncbi:MAG TPA: GtrA family protein [Candidatus Binatia bacterium]|nr:GtrA family protein [Candidatus Binatia bacterium]